MQCCSGTYWEGQIKDFLKGGVKEGGINTFCELCTKENTRIKQVLKENGYQESIISKSFKKITNNHTLPQSQQQMQATVIREEDISIH